MDPMEASPAVISWLRQNIVPLTSASPGSDLNDIASSEPMISTARVIGLGEATHNTREFFELKHRIVEYVVNQGCPTLLLMEAPFPQSMAVNRYILTGEGDPSHALASLAYWCWDCDEVLELIEWMRSWNASHPNKVQFYGFDMQTSAPAALYLLEFFRRIKPACYDALCSALSSLATDMQSNDWALRTKSEKLDIAETSKSVFAELDKLIGNDSIDQYELGIARLHAAVLSQYQTLWEDPSIERWSSLRDRAMADNVISLLDLHGRDTKALVWAHNGHIGLTSGGEFDIKSPPMGEYLRRHFDKDYLAVGFAFDEGSFGAIDELFRIRNFRVFSVAGSLDATLGEIQTPIFMLDLRDTPAEVSDWLADRPATRSIGGGYFSSADELFWRRTDTSKVFDALIFVKETTAASRRKTASYMFEFSREVEPNLEGFSNLDFSDGLAGWRSTPQPDVGSYRTECVNIGRCNWAEMLRDENFWPWDVFSLSQTSTAKAWRDSFITIRSFVKLAPAHGGSSAHLAVRILDGGKSEAAAIEALRDSSSRSWFERAIWQHAATSQPVGEELVVRCYVGGQADTVSIALVMTGDGRASFGPISISSERGN
jgi:erythromycin esterase